MEMENDNFPYNYNPTSTELRHAYEVAYVEMGVYHLVGAMYASLNQPAIERIYQAVIQTVKEQLQEQELI